MANEIGITASLMSRRTTPAMKASAQATPTQVGSRFKIAIQEIGTAAEQLDFGDVAAGTVGYVMVENLDTTNYIQLGLDSGVSTQIFAKIPAGLFVILTPNSNTIYAKANTAAVYVRVMAVEA